MKKTRSLILGILRVLSKKRLLQLKILLILIFLSALSELLTLGSFYPFLTILSNPENLLTSPITSQIANYFKITASNDLIIPVVVVFASSAIISSSLRLLNIWINLRLAASIGSELSSKAYEAVLNQPYEKLLNLNSSALITSVTTNTDRSVSAINCLLIIITNSIISISIAFGIFLINYKIALSGIIFFAFIYFFLAKLIKKQLYKNSKIIAHKSKLVIKSLQEGLGSIRDVILDCNQSTYLDIYKKANRPKRELEAENIFLGNSPRYVIEGFILFIIAITCGIISLKSNGNSSNIVMLGSLVLGAQRLLPTVQQVYNNWVGLQSFNADLNSLLGMINLKRNKILSKKINPLQLKEKIELKSVSFTYNLSIPYAISDFNLEIKKGEKVGIIGKTGSGKSTLMDILIGMIKPNKGSLFVDGEDIHNPIKPHNLLAWRKSIAHVPQNIYLADSSIAENIAFGVPKKLISMSLIKESAKKAQIHNFIENLKNGYSTFVGERGVKLSGGQKQRIGIARAIYKKSKILVFDEATSALDNETELATIEAIEGLNKDLTIIMIAHRLSTLRNCDRIINLKNGKIISQGNPKDFV